MKREDLGVMNRRMRDQHCHLPPRGAVIAVRPRELPLQPSGDRGGSKPHNTALRPLVRRTCCIRRRLPDHRSKSGVFQDTVPSCVGLLPPRAARTTHDQCGRSARRSQRLSVGTNGQIFLCILFTLREILPRSKEFLVSHMQVVGGQDESAHQKR